MDSLDEAARRLTELEIKASFTEDLLDQLNQVIVRWSTPAVAARCW